MRTTAHFTRPDDPTAPERFWKKVEKTESGCWNWTGAKDRLGYGKFWYRGNRSEYAHRVVLMMRGDVLPDRWTTGLVVDHTCRNRGCVNPDHLRIVSQRANTLENSICPHAKNAAKIACKRGHPFSPENTRINKRGHRGCKACAKIHAQNARENRNGM